MLHFVLHTLEVRIDFFRLLLHLVGDDAAVDALHDAVRSPSAPCDDILVLHADRMHDRRGIVPLRYNNDKQKKPLFSRGLSVCRLLFNSFSKLKIDENYKEKRRLFY